MSIRIVRIQAEPSNCAGNIKFKIPEKDTETECEIYFTLKSSPDPDVTELHPEAVRKDRSTVEYFKLPDIVVSNNGAPYTSTEKACVTDKVIAGKVYFNLYDAHTGKLVASSLTKAGEKGVAEFCFVNDCADDCLNDPDEEKSSGVDADIQQT